MSMIELKITGMTCAHCVQSVTRALQGVPGVDKAEVDLAGGVAHVRGQADSAALIAAVQDAGYVARRVA
jgi:copper chaperone